jgi:hypothetical protein
MHPVHSQRSWQAGHVQSCRTTDPHYFRDFRHEVIEVKNKTITQLEERVRELERRHL